MSRLGVVCLLLVLLIGEACHAGDRPVSASEFYGTWKVTRIAAVGYGSDSEARMKALVGTKVKVSAQEIVEGGDVCDLSGEHVAVSLVDTYQDADIRLGRVSPAVIGLPKVAPKMDAGCMILFKAGKRLVFGDRGAYYMAERIQK